MLLVAGLTLQGTELPICSTRGPRFTDLATEYRHNHIDWLIVSRVLVYILWLFEPTLECLVEAGLSHRLVDASNMYGHIKTGAEFY